MFKLLVKLHENKSRASLERRMRSTTMTENVTMKKKAIAQTDNFMREKEEKERKQLQSEMKKKKTMQMFDEGEQKFAIRKQFDLSTKQKEFQANKIRLEKEA